MIVDASLAATVVNFVLTALASGVGISIVGFLVKNVALERIRQSIAAEYATELERLKAELDLAVRRPP